MALGLRRKLILCLPILAVACRSPGAGASGTQTATSSATSAPSPAAPAPTPTPAAAPFGPRASQFLVRNVEAGQILLVSSQTGASRELTRASGGLYQAQLGLLWYRTGTQLKVLDLDQATPSPVTVAEGMPEVDRFAITEHSAHVDTEDGCDLASVELKWSAEPSIESAEESAPELRLVNATWLQTQRQREAHPIGARKALSNAKTHVRLPKKLLACEEPGDCGSVLPLGNTGLELVLVRQQAGGDCVQTACMLRDPKTKQFAKPPHAESWGRADKSRLGPCGPYMFDRAQTSYLVDNQLCTPEGCKTLPGPALGWLEPGDRVGEPGVGNFDDEP